MINHLMQETFMAFMDFANCKYFTFESFNLKILIKYISSDLVGAM